MVIIQSVDVALEVLATRVQDQVLDLHHLVPAIDGAEGDLAARVVGAVVIGIGKGAQVIRTVELELDQKDLDHLIEVFAGIEAVARVHCVAMTGREMPRGKAALAHILITDTKMSILGTSTL